MTKTTIRHSFRDHHLLLLLNEYSEQKLPLDYFMSRYFRAHSALGSKDRGYIAETAYALVRWRGLLDARCSKPITWEKRLQVYQSTDLTKRGDHKNLPLNVQLSFPQRLFQQLVSSHGQKKAIELCRISNAPAPTYIRINPMKTTRDEMLSRWQDQFPIHPCETSPYGITFRKKVNFWTLPEFRQGLFEVQDEGSQLIADLVQAEPKQHVLDYCSGSGGKTLAFAHRLKNTGQIFLHDIRAHILIEAKKRLRRAGIQNAQFLEAGAPPLKKLKKKMDWVLVDVPCTGTGTMRRNPDMKWNFTAETLPRLVGQQRTIFEQALSYLHPEGHIVYATCSILKEENEEQVDHFVKTYDLEVVKSLTILPSEGKMDGFFGVVLKRKRDVLSSIPLKTNVTGTQSS